MIKPDEIPQFTGNLFQLELDHAALKKDAGNVRDTGKDVHSQFQGLSAFYKAPEAEQLFATTKPVQDRAEDFATGLETVSGALSSYATEIRPLVAKLAELKTKAQAFVSSVKDDDDWEYDEDKVGEHNQLRDDITATVAAFWAAERTCHNKITAIWNGTQMVAGDGSDRKDQYGFNAEDLKNAKLPWGDPVEEKHHWYEVGHWVKSFVWDGLIVDGVWGTIKGLGTLVGFGGWEAMGQAWKGLAQLATGIALASIPGVGTAFWLLPDDKLPSWIRDSRTAMKETGKALVAWDEWGKNPGRAAGAVTFNVLTTVFTGGAGGAAAGAGKAGAVAKVLSVAGKAGKVIDPMTYIAKGAGAGLSKIGDITKALKGVGNIEIPKLPETAIHLPEGTSVLPDGTVRLPEGAAVPAGLHELPGGGFKVPDDVPVVHEDALPVKAEGGEPTLYADGHGNIVDGQGKVLLDVDKPGTQDIVDRPAGPDSTGPAGSDVPRVDSPAKVPAMAGAAPHTVDAGTHINLGDSLGDVGRVGEDVPVAPGVHAGGDIPNVHAGGDLPGAQVGDHLPGAHAGGDLPGGSASHAPGGSADHLPGGSADHVPGGSAHEHGAGPSASHEPPNTHPGGHGDGTGQGPNGHSADGAHDGSGAGHHDATTHGHADTDGAGTGHGDAESGHGHGSDGRDGGPATVGHENSTGGGDNPSGGVGHGHEPERVDYSEGDEKAAQPTGRLQPDQEAAVAEQLANSKMAPHDIEKCLTGLRKSEYGAGIAKYISEGKLSHLPGYSELLSQCKQVSKASDMSPAVYMAMEHAADLQARGVKGLAFEWKVPGEGLDLDVLVRSGNRIEYGAQLKDVNSASSLNSATRGIAEKQLLGNIDGQKVAILDVHDTKAALTDKILGRIAHRARITNATFVLRFRDGSITVPANGPTYP